MYINKIDDFIDKVLDDFNNYIITNDTFNVIINDLQFTKHQKEINNLLQKYIKTINLEEIKNLVKNKDMLDIIVNIIKRYITIYFFLCVGLHNSKSETKLFITNLIEFTKNQHTYEFKVSDFFNSESNALIIKYYIINNFILEIVNKHINKKQKHIANKDTDYKYNPDFKKAQEIIEELGNDYIEQSFVVPKLNNNINLQIQNILKTIIFIYIYNQNEKNNIINILQTIEQEQGEYIYIDIVVPRKQFINLEIIQQLFHKNKKHANHLFEFLSQEDNLNNKIHNLTPDEKILELINNNILVPIVDDFLLYHKNTTQYLSGDTDKQTSSKKENTKIKFIINKYDKISDLYSEKAKSNPKLLIEIKKHFYAPLANRKAILYNNIEELKIINKVLNIGKKADDNSEYYDELLNYRKYPYINFKDFKNYGFSFQCDRPTDVIRYASFEIKQSKNNDIQFRSSNMDQYINIVGFLIPTVQRNIKCLKIKNTSSCTDFKDIMNNGYEFVLKFLEDISFNMSNIDTNIYWIFDINKDKKKMETYEQTNKLNMQDQIKHLVSSLYDELTIYIYNRIISIIKDQHLKSSLYLHESYNIIDKIEEVYMKLDHLHPLYITLENNIYYENIIKVLPKYDIKEDIFYGFGDKIIKLEDMSLINKKRSNFVKIKVDITKQHTKQIQDTEDRTNYICQHIISWNELAELQTNDPNKYNTLLHEFIEKYAVENSDKEYVCKSCGININIQRFISNSMYDDETGKYVIIPSDLSNITLEELPEYRDYTISINTLERLIEKVASITNFVSYMGSNNVVKLKKKQMIKNIIDFTLLHNNNLKSKLNIKDRNINAVKLYGINRDLSNFFIFTLEDNIFTYSKDKDVYKPIKYNNILIYLIIYFILEINPSNLHYMMGDKKSVCNYSMFEKHKLTLFDGLKIITNTSGDTEYITKYNLLCYIIYILSCTITKYKVWQFEYIKDMKFNPKVQKIIIHTILDILNSILEVGSLTDIKQSRLYDEINNIFYMKMKTFYTEQDISSIITNVRPFNILVNKDIINNKQSSIQLDISTYTDTDPSMYITRPFYKLYPAMIKPKSRAIKSIFISKSISSLTNCLNGQFHNWKIQKNTQILECTKCKLLYTSINNSNSDTIKENNKYLELEKLAQIYCLDGHLHYFTTNNICNLCSKPIDYVYSTKELDILESKLIKKQYHKKQIHNTTNKDNSDITSKLDKLKQRYNRDTSSIDPFKFINQFIKNIQLITGDDITHNKDIILQYNRYMIDHDHFGNKLNKTIIIYENDNKIHFKNNHSFFKTSVIYYTNLKYGKLEVYYDAYTNLLIGYRENDKDYIRSKLNSNKIEISYSLMNKIKLLGYSSQFLPSLNEENIYEELNYINRKRINNIKKIINIVQTTLFRLKNNFNIEDLNKKQIIDNSQKTNLQYQPEPNPLQDIFTKHLNIKDLKIEDPNSNKRIYKHHNDITTNIFVKVLDDNTNINPSGLYLMNDISIYDPSGNILLYYLITELDKLLHYNTNKNTINNIIYLIVDLIDYSFQLFNTDKLNNNIEIKKFNYIMESEYIASYTEDKTYTDDIIDVDDENYIKEQENKIDIEEEDDAIDIDIDPEDTLDANNPYIHDDDI